MTDQSNEQANQESSPHGSHELPRLLDLRVTPISNEKEFVLHLSYDEPDDVDVPNHEVALVDQETLIRVLTQLVLKSVLKSKLIE